MEKNRTVSRLCFFLTAALTLVAVILRTVAMLTGFDADIGYFAPSFTVTLNHALYFVTGGLLIALVLFIPRDTLPQELHTPLRAPLAILTGVVLAAFAVAALVICVPLARGRLILAPTLLGLPAAVYFLITANRGGRYTDLPVLTGFIPVIWCVSGIAELYFDPYVTMNSPVKISLQMGLLGFVFIVLFELRYRIGRALPRVAVVAFGTGSFACLNASVPLLIATGARVTDHPLHAFYAMVLLSAGLYGLHSLYGCACSPAVAPAATPAVVPVDPPADAPDSAE